MTRSPTAPIRFQPRLVLHTLGRGDGLLGMRPAGPFGPRGGQVTVAQVEWLYSGADGRQWTVPAAPALPDGRAAATALIEDEDSNRLVLRDTAAEAAALARLHACGLLPLPRKLLQWRAADIADKVIGKAPLWTLEQEAAFGDFWAEQAPVLQAEGWSVAVRPGFAHESVPVAAWRLVLDPDTGEARAREAAAPLRGRQVSTADLSRMPHESSWLLSLGVEIEGETLDLTPMLVQLLRRDPRWLDAKRLEAIDDEEVIRLRAPGGRRIETLAAPIKAIVGSMLDLLTAPRRKDGPIRLDRWDADRLEALRLQLMHSQRERAGPRGAWQLQGETGLRMLASRLQEAGAAVPAAAPAGLGIVLRDYQLQGLGWLQYLRAHHLAGILADDMGLGKTAQALAHLLIEKQAGRLDCPALVVVPSSLVFNWQAEARRIAPALRVISLQEPDRATRTRRIADIDGFDVVLTTYALLWRDLSALSAHRFHLLILDEAQTVKNAASRSAAAIRRLRAQHRLCITGTPLENHLGELWTQFDFLMPGFLGDARSFMRQWRRPIEVNGETVRARLLAQRVRPFILRRRKDDVLTELPAKTVAIRRVRLEGQQRDLYESVRVAADEKVRQVLQRKGFDGAQITIMDALLKLRQVCCDPWLLAGYSPPETMERAKMALLLDMLDALAAEGRRVLVFSQFASMLRLIGKELDRMQLPWLSLTGETPPGLRGEVVARFQSGGPPIMLISLKAGGVGLNLTAADTVIHTDPWWNPAVEEQATARAHRLGQTQPVFVYKLVAEGSIEERILALQERKAALAEGVLGSDSEAVAKFGEDELRALLAPLQYHTG